MKKFWKRYRSIAVCMRHRAMKERMRKWKRKIEKQFLNMQREGGVTDETGKTGKKCDPGNNQKQKMLSAGILTAVIGAVVAALIPPLILAKIIDTVTAGNEAAFSVILLYFVLLALTGILEAAREGLLTVFGQKITHALRSSLMDKFVSLTADSVNKQEPGTLVSRFVGDVDTVENLFASGIISMFADVCKIISILVVIWFQNRGLTLVLLVLLPFYSGLPDMSKKYAGGAD